MPTETAAATQSLTSLIAQINNKHHAYMRSELPFLEQRLAKMCANHGTDRPELFKLQQLLQDLRDDIIEHLAKEEQILFPYVTALEASRETGAAMPHACFATIQHPLRVMLMEHDTVQNILVQMREASGNYTKPDCFCENGAEFYSRLAAMDADLREHIKVENEVLFPRAVQLEESSR